MKVIAIVEGGILRDAYAESEHVELEVIDLDDERADDYEHDGKRCDLLRQSPNWHHVY